VDLLARQPPKHNHGIINVVGRSKVSLIMHTCKKRT
jgi:hypothetical protein